MARRGVGRCELEIIGRGQRAGIKMGIPTRESPVGGPLFDRNRPHQAVCEERRKIGEMAPDALSCRSMAGRENARPYRQPEL